MIKFTCPTCGHEFSVSQELAGKRQKCFCGNEIIFPDTVGIDSHAPKETITNPESITDAKSVTGWETIQVVFAPWMIPRIALRCSMFYALFVSSFILTWEIDVMLHGCLQGIGEPYVDWQHYFFSFSPDIVFLFFVIQTTVLFFILRFLTSLVSHVFQVKPATIRVVLLTPTLLIFPSHIWAFATMITVVREPSFSFSIDKPEWIHWTIFTFLSEPYWLVIGLITLVGAGFVNAFRVRKLCRQRKIERVGQMNLKNITLIAAILASLSALYSTFSFISFLATANLEGGASSIPNLIGWPLALLSKYSMAAFLVVFYRCQGKKE